MLDGEHSNLSAIEKDRVVLLVAARVHQEKALADLIIIRERIVGQDLVIRDLRNNLWQVQEVATRLSKQLGKALSACPSCNEAWSHWYLEGLDRICDCVILNPQHSSKALEAHMRALDFKILEPNATTLNHVSELGRETIQDVFLPEDDDPSDFLPMSIYVARTRGGDFDDAPISIEREQDPAKTGSSNLPEGLKLPSLDPPPQS